MLAAVNVSVILTELSILALSTVGEKFDFAADACYNYLLSEAGTDYLWYD